MAPPTQQPKLRPVFVLDTNVLMAAVASGQTEGPDNNSQLDKETREKKIDSEKLRGKLINMLTVGALAIPEIVREEFKAIARRQNSPMGGKNKKFAEKLLEVLKDRTIEYNPTREEVIRQGNAVETLQKDADLSITSLQKAGIDIPLDWRKVINEKDKGETPPWKRQLRKIPAVVTWAKIADLAPTAVSERGALPKTGETTQRELLKEACRLRQLNDRPESPQDPETSNRNTQIAELEEKAKGTRPQLIPDWEIFFTAQRCQACLITLDGDMKVIARQTTGIPPEIGGPGQAGPKNMEELLTAISDNLKSHKKIAKRLNRAFEIN